MAGELAETSGRFSQFDRIVIPARKAMRQSLIYLIATVLAAAFMAPFFWTISSALKGPWEVIAYPPTLVPKEVRWQNFVDIWVRWPFATWTVNSIVVCVLAVIGQTASASVVAYGFARIRFPGREALFLVVLSTMMLPIQVTIIPLFLLYRQIGWLDTLLPLIVPHWFGGGAFFIFLLRQFFRTIPKDLDEAAEIDGCGKLGILWQVVVPLSKPALTTVVIFSFLFNWNEFFQPLFFLNSNDKYTLPLGLRFFQTFPTQGGEPKWHLLMAASTVITVPVVLLFFLGQRYFIQGVVMTGLKG